MCRLDVKVRLSCVPCLLMLGLSGCGGSSDRPSTTTDEGIIDTSGSQPEPSPLGEPSQQLSGQQEQSGGAGLTFSIEPDCGETGDSVSLVLRSANSDVGTSDGSEQEQLFGRNVTGYATLEQFAGPALQLLSRDDEAVRASLPVAGQVAVTAAFNGGSVTRYFAAFDAEAAPEAVLRTPTANGCLVTLRLPDYCATISTTAVDFQLGLDERIITGSGCRIDNPNGYPITDLP